MLQPTAVSAQALIERLRTPAGRRILAFGLVLLVEALLLWLLLTLNVFQRPEKSDEIVPITDVQSITLSEEAPAPSSAAPQRPRTSEQPRPRTDTPQPRQPTQQQAVQPQPAQPAPANPVPTTPPVFQSPFRLPPSSSTPASPARPAPSSGAVYGPPDTGGSPAFRDSAIVGSAPNGQPLYAAAWYREPSQSELSGFLDTASGPGWGLIMCRTAPNYRVEDCRPLDEYPTGSQINRAILAAAYQFQVRPPRRGGRELVGAWVRIRIDYYVRRR